jgi:hypothetical protein
MDNVVIDLVISPCAGPTYWVYKAGTTAPIRKLANHTVKCLAHPYSVEVRPCSGLGYEPPDLPVTIRLVRHDSKGGGRPRRVVVHRQQDRAPHVFVFGNFNSNNRNVAGTGTFRLSPGPFPNGKYSWYSHKEATSELPIRAL